MAVGWPYEKILRIFAATLLTCAQSAFESTFSRRNAELWVGVRRHGDPLVHRGKSGACRAGGQPISGDRALNGRPGGRPQTRSDSGADPGSAPLSDSYRNTVF